MDPERDTSIVGRGISEGAGLFRDWYASLTEAAERNASAAYVFVMGSLVELLRTFDLPVVFPEINSLQTAVRRVSLEYLSRAEEYGYSPDVCGYVKGDIGLQLRGGEHPMGRIPRPSLAVVTNACNTYIKWAEIWERLYGIPVFTLDVPGSRSAAGDPPPGDPSFEQDRVYVEDQIRELVGLCEKVTGIPLDVDRLRAVLAEVNEASRCWGRILELNRNRPAVFNALTDGTVFLGVANALRGTPEGSGYFRRLLEELELKAELGLGTLADERHRLIFVGVPCYPMFRRFTELFTERGGVFVASTYLSFAAGGLDLGYSYDLDHPLESLAEGVLRCTRTAMDRMFFHDRALLQMAESFGVDGIVYHPIKSCRTVSTGLADSRRAVMADRDIACLFIESDLVDPRAVSEAQIKNRVDAFFEGLTARRLRTAAVT
jgi:benzoyl-CoA reductase subunit B